jgi:phospholipase C
LGGFVLRKFPVFSGLRPGAFSSLIFISIFASCAFLGCGIGSTTVVGPPPPAISVAVQAAAGTVDATDPTQLTATVTNDRNSAGVSWTVSGAGKLSDESTSAVTYTAPAPSNSAQTVTVTATSNADSTKTASATITVLAGPAITFAASGSGFVGSAYSQPLAASGGIPPYTWTLKGGTLPSCLTLTASSSAASIGGTPNSSCVGTFSNLILQVTDSGMPNALSASTPALQITIAAAPPITFAGPVLGSATYNVAFTGSAAAVGGAGALTYSSTGALPTGISLNTSSGALTGTPTVVGIYRFSVMASDAYGDSSSQSYLIGVSQANNTPIQHVVVIMQENRTFDNMFNGFPGADTVQSGSNHGAVVPLTPVPLAETVGFDHSHLKWWQAWDNGKMDGFAANQTTPPLYSYTYVQPSDLQTYWTMASQYTLADQFFQSNTGPSMPSHEYMIAAQSADADENPVPSFLGCDAPTGTTVALVGPDGTDINPGVFPCFDYLTTGDLLDDNGVTWRFYAALTGSPDLSVSGPYEYIQHIFYGIDGKTNIIAPPTQVLTDIANGELAQVTWVEPDAAHSDIPGNNSNEGPDWVASVVNTVGASPFWNSTAILINWDDWGGLYDHVAPVNIDEMGPGFRTPLIVVSPYAKHGYVFHGVSETASLVTFIEKIFNLPDLSQRDAGANDLLGCFDFTQSPSPYVRIKTKVTVDQLLHEKPTGPPDDD